MLSTPQNTNTQAAPGAPIAIRYDARRQNEVDIGVPVARRLMFEAVENPQPVQVATPAAQRNGADAPAAPIRVLPAELIQLEVDTGVARNLDDLFANAD